VVAALRTCAADRSKDDVNFFREQHPQRSKRAVLGSTEVDEVDVTVHDASTYSTSTKHIFTLDTNSEKKQWRWRFDGDAVYALVIPQTLSTSY